MYKYEELLIDGDLLVFSRAAAVEYGNPYSPADLTRIIQNVEGAIHKMKARLKAKHVRIFFTDPDNFRYTILDGYKANRVGSYKPEHLANAISHIKVMFNGEQEQGLEADDLLAKYQKQDGSTIIATIDKDIPQVRGWHYRWETQHKGEAEFEVTGLGKLELFKKGNKSVITGNGIRFFCYQLLVGDPTDGIMGCGKLVDKVYKSGAKAGEAYTKREGIGPVKAFNLLEHRIGYAKAMKLIANEYANVYGDDWEEQLLANGRALFLVNKTEGDLIQLWHYNPTKFKDSWFNVKTKEMVV